MSAGKQPYKQANNQSKRMIWVALLISLFITLFISYLSYRSFSDIKSSVAGLSQPDTKIELLNSTLSKIVEAEGNIKYFILTGDSASEVLYREQIESAANNIQLLKQSFEDDPSQIRMVDSLEVIYNKKLQSLEEYLEVKDEKQRYLFTSDALEEISKNIDDTLTNISQLLTTEVINGMKVPVEKREIVVTPDEYKGMRGFFRKIFGGDQTVIDTVKTIEENVEYSRQVNVDTSLVKSYYRDSTLFKIRNILAPIIRKERDLQQRLVDKELELLKQDRAFIANIRSIINTLKTDEKKKADYSNEQATATANESIRFILISGITGLLLSAILLFLVMRDITRSNFYRTQLEVEKDRAEELSSIKEQFLSNMSHEIRTPLQSIRGFSELMEQSKLDEKQQQYMEAINFANRYLTDLISDILDQAKIGAGKLELITTPFTIRDITNELDAIFSYSAQRKNIVLKNKIQNDLEVQLLGDSLRIKQIITNLLSNAIKFTHEGYVALEVNVLKQDHYRCQLHINVKDTGVGIPEELHDRVFEQFSQNTQSVVKNYGGTGLGLSITKSLVEAMEGTITLESKPNQGSAFQVVIPLTYQEVEEKQEVDSQVEKMQEHHFKAKILVVDDDTWNTLLLQEFLAPRVDELIVFNHPGEALEYLKNHSVDLIFTDVQMPEMDGFELLNQIRARGIKVPVVALTADFNVEKNEQHKRFDAICRKPYKTANIGEILHRFLSDLSSIVKADFEKEQEDAQNRIKTAVFDFEFIRKYAGEDEEVYHKLLLELVNNNNQNRAQFDVLLHEKKSAQLAELCHKMKPMYEQLKLENISEALYSIELYVKISKTARALEEAELLQQKLKEIQQQLNDAVSHSSYT
tara:strand:+ start:2207 stop:4801 length:2595 start_codon:yes stop_codon:yes gene_type:complete